MIDVFAQGVVSQALRKGLLYFFMYKAIVIQKIFVSLRCLHTEALLVGGTDEDGDLYIGKALLDALCLTHWNLAVSN